MSWIPNFFISKSDGGSDSGVTAHLFFEWKKFFSVGLLRFSRGSRESFHSHAFNAITWWLSGSVTEEDITGEKKNFGPSLKPKITPRSKIHRVIGNEVTYALTFRGPWQDQWKEIRDGKEIKLTHGRKEC